MKGTIQLAQVCALVAYTASQAVADAGTFSTDFNAGLPTNSTVFGNAVMAATGGYTNSGCLQLTTAVASQSGSFVITNDLDEGVPAVSFTASFRILIGGGQRWNYGDGLSFNFAADVPLGTTSSPENGVGTGISVGFRTTPVVGNSNPTITASGYGTPATGSPTYVDNVRANTFIDAVIQLNPDNTLSVVYDGAYIYSNVPVNFYPGPGSLFWIGAGTSSQYENHFIDDLHITTRTNAMPYITSYAPRGRQAPAGSSIDVVVTNFNTALSPNSVTLNVDGAAVSPAVASTFDGNTRIHFAPGPDWIHSSQHTVTVMFADNATPAQTQMFSWKFTVAEALPTNFVTVLSDSFESYVLGKIDKEPLYWSGGANGPNAAPNGSGNPWFGPYGPNCGIVNAEGAVSPHTGNNMIRGNVVGDQDALWCDVAYRFHNGQPIKGNCELDWWQYDPYTSTSATAFKDYVSFYYYNNETFPATADWPEAWNTWTTSQAQLFWANGIDYTLEQSVTLGGSGYSQPGGNSDPTKYQIRLEEKSGATYGLDGWCNTSVPRTTGWHHNRILMGPPHTNGTVMVYFYIDDMLTPAYSGLSTLAATGFGLIEIVTAWGDTDQAYYDDLSFALVRPPDVTATAGMGQSITLTWPGEGFALQSSPGFYGPWTDVPGATSGYSYDITSGKPQFFRLRD